MSTLSRIAFLPAARGAGIFTREPQRGHQFKLAAPWAQMPSKSASLDHLRRHDPAAAVKDESPPNAQTGTPNA
jgi:hypothetical protein